MIINKILLHVLSPTAHLIWVAIRELEAFRELSNLVLNGISLGRKTFLLSLSPGTLHRGILLCAWH